MRKAVILLVVALGALALPLTAYPQVCGDANGDARVNVSDVVFLFSYLSGLGPSPNLSNADCDDRLGVTLGDASALVDYIFAGGPAPDCTPSQVYSLTYSDSDTLFLPYIFDIPEGVDSVSLPIVSALGAGAKGYYLPLLVGSGLTGNATFELHSVSKGATQGGLLFNGFKVVDTAVLMALDLFNSEIVGTKTLFFLNYRRIAPGLGNISPMMLERSSLWVPSVSRNRDLLRPHTVAKEFVFPPESLMTTPSQLTYAAMAGKTAADSFLVNFTSTGIPITFSISVSDPWIRLINPPTTLTTPASIWVKASADSLAIGDYTGQINILPNKPSTPMNLDAVTVTFNVTTPVVFPPGDFNCDGICDVADLAALVNYIMGGSIILKECNR